MSRVRFDLNLSGLNQLMKSPEMQSILTQKGSEVLARVNGMKQDPDAEYGMSTKTINWIAVTNVRAENGAAVRENLEQNSLLKALGGGG